MGEAEIVLAAAGRPSHPCEAGSRRIELNDSRETDDGQPCVEVPHAQLAPDVLRRLIEEFVTRDGTDYGAVERTLEEKVAVVLAQLDAGEAAVVVDTESETVDIVARRPG